MKTSSVGQLIGSGISKCMSGQIAIYNLWIYHAYQTVWYTSLNQYTTPSAHHLNDGLKLTHYCVSHHSGD